MKLIGKIITRMNRVCQPPVGIKIIYAFVRMILSKGVVMAGFLTMCMVTQGYAITAAVFPVDDLSMQHNSINSRMTEFLAAELQGLGVEIVPEKALLSYMAAMRIRHLGMLDSREIMATRTELGADLVLLGSLCQAKDNPLSIGMTISLIRTSDGKTIWTSSKGVSKNDSQRFLGVNTPSTVEKIEHVLAASLFADWPADLNFTAGLRMAGAQIAAVKETTFIEVDSVFFSPKFLRPGQDINCTIRFKTNGTDKTGAKVFIKVGNRVHLASSEDGIYYKAAWVGSGEQSGENVQVAMNSVNSQVLKGVWNSDRKDANYPVSLILDWPSGKRDESYLGAYVVDSRAPEVSIKLRGKKIDGITAFRGELPIKVRFKRSEPIVKWDFVVVDKELNQVLRSHGSGMVPPELLWRGQNSKNIREKNGVYQITLRVWDRAGNVGTVSEKVLLLARKPAIDLQLEQDDSLVTATLTASDQVPVVSWRLELWSTDNQLVKSLHGDSLPAKVTLAQLHDATAMDTMECILSVRDSMGTKSTQKLDNVLSMIVVESNDELTVGSSASDDWQADF